MNAAPRRRRAPQNRTHRRWIPGALGACGLAIAGVSLHAAYTRTTDDSAAISATFTVLKSFSGGSDGAYPLTGLVQSTDGNLYGTTSGLVPGGGTSGSGTVFKVNSGGVETSLHSFVLCGGDGTSAPDAPLMAGLDGNLYGTSSNTCGNSGAALYKVTPAGVVSFIHLFNPALEGAGHVALTP